MTTPSIGAFALADFGLASWNNLKASLNYQSDTARIQDDIGLPFVKYSQGTFSAALEDEVKLAEDWRAIGGLSLDVIDKFSGPSTSRLNPLLGLKYSPREELDIHVSVSQKSRLPNMRSLYSTSGGNPDLLGESGTNAEIGLTWNKGVYVSAAAFTYKFKNMIDTYVRPDGVRQYMNVGRAHIDGLEIQVQKSLGWIDGTISYTYLSHRNDVDNRPLDALSPNTLNFDLSVRPIGGLRLGCLRPAGLAVPLVRLQVGQGPDHPRLFQSGRRGFLRSGPLPGLRQGHQSAERLFLRRAGLPLAGPVHRIRREDRRLLTNRSDRAPLGETGPRSRTEEPRSGILLARHPGLKSRTGSGA